MSDSEEEKKAASTGIEEETTSKSVKVSDEQIVEVKPLEEKSVDKEKAITPLVEKPLPSSDETIEVKAIDDATSCLDGLCAGKDEKPNNKDTSDDNTESTPDVASPEITKEYPISEPNVESKAKSTCCLM